MSDGKCFKLKDESTGFHDPETGLKVVRNQRVHVSGAAGKMTMQAIHVGRLVEVATDESNATEGTVHARGKKALEKEKRESRGAPQKREWTPEAD